MRFLLIIKFFPVFKYFSQFFVKIEKLCFNFLHELVFSCAEICYKTMLFLCVRPSLILSTVFDHGNGLLKTRIILFCLSRRLSHFKCYWKKEFHMRIMTIHVMMETEYCWEKDERNSQFLPENEE